MFAELQPRRTKEERLHPQAPKVRETLQSILKLAPNHLSAKYLIAGCEKTRPQVDYTTEPPLSLSLIIYPYNAVLGSKRSDQPLSLPVQ